MASSLHAISNRCNRIPDARGIVSPGDDLFFWRLRSDHIRERAEGGVADSKDPRHWLEHFPLAGIFTEHHSSGRRGRLCGNVYSSRGDAIQGAYVSLKAEFLTVSLISIPNASTDFSSLKRILLLGCLQAIRVQGKTTRAHYKPLSSFTTKTGVGVQATTTYAEG